MTCGFQIQLFTNNGGIEVSLKGSLKSGLQKMRELC